MAERVPTVMNLPTETFRQTLDQLHDRASSIISLSLQWNDFDQHLASTKTAIKERSTALLSAQESVERKLEDVKNRESELDEKERAIVGRERDFEIIQKKENEELKRAVEEIEKSRAELIDKEKKLSEKIGEMENIEKELKLKEEQIEEKRKELDVKFTDLELKEKMIQEVELEKNKYEKLCKEVESKPKQVSHGFSANIDGKSLQIYLNEHWREIESMRLAVSMALGHSPDPSMLVLDALQGFYPPHLKKSDTEFDGVVVKSSCSLLLEELMKLSPEIRANAKKEAKRVAFDWVKKLKSDSKHFLEVLCFLQLLACYGLASDFNSDRQLTRVEIVANHSLAPALFRALGLADKVSDFVRNLIKRKKLNAAIKFIYEFGMVGQFQPVSLLNDFLAISLTDTENLRKKKETRVGQINASKKRLADIKYALRCIEEYKIDYGPEHTSLEQQIGILEKEISKWKEAAALGDKTLKLCDEKDQHLAPAVDASATGSTSVSATSAAATQLQRLSGNKRSRADVSAEKNVKEYCAPKRLSDKEILERKADIDKIQKLYDEKETENQVTVDVSSKTKIPSESNKASESVGSQPKTKSLSVNPSKEELKKLLDMCEKNKSGESEIAAALRSANDPGKLVLDIMNVPVPFMPDGTGDFKVKMLKSSCILLLRQLREASPEINAQIRDGAKKFALYWETVLTKRNNKSPLDVICFLQFLASFKLGSAFDAHKLLGLLDSDHWRKEAPDLCKDLGLADKIPSFIQNRIKKEQYIEAVKYIYSLNMVDKFSPVSILKLHLSTSSEKSRKRPLEAQIVDMDKEIESHEDVIKCVSDYKITGLSVEKLKETLAQLEKEKRELKSRRASAQRSSASGSKGKPKQWDRNNKHQRTHNSSDYHRNRYNGGKSAMDRHPLQHPPVPYMSRDVPYSPPGHHVLPAAYPPRDVEFNNYGATVTPAYHWDALGNFGPDRPFHY